MSKARTLPSNFARPKANMTGFPASRPIWSAVSLLGSALEAKRLGLLNEIVPGAASIGLLVNPGYPDADRELREVQAATAAINRQIITVRATTAACPGVSPKNA